MYDTTNEEERNQNMAIIKAPPKQPKAVTIQARVEESVKTQLDQYAKFIESTPSYVITEALKVLFKRDDEFKAWLGQQSSHGKIHELAGAGFKETA
jgi:predicted transcriptional regulator